MSISKTYFKWIIKEVKTAEFVKDAAKTSMRIEVLLKEGKIDEAYKIFEEVSKTTGKPIPDVAVQFFTETSIEIVQADKELDNSFPEALYEKIKLKIIASESKKIVLRIDEGLTLPQIRAIIKKLWEKERRVVFIIAPSNELDGRIIADNMNFDKMELVKGYVKNIGGQDSYIAWTFGEPASKYQGKVMESLTHRYREYTFKDNKGAKYLILSNKELKTGKCKIKGVLTPLDDRKKVGELATKGVTIDVFFLHEHIPYSYNLTQEQVKVLRNKFDSHEIMADKLFGKRRHPIWFERLMFSILYSSKDYGYPSHFLMVGPAGTGKTKGILNPLKVSLDESKAPVSGNTSTIKGLIPSFRESPPSIGHLCEADRVALVDELFTFIGRANNETVRGRPQDGGNFFQLLKDILEHEEKDAMSGNSRTRIKMSAIMIAVTNPIEYHGLTDIPSFAEKVDKAFLSRFILYDQTDQHINFINDRKIMVSEIGEEEAYPELDYDFVNLFDFMKTIKIKGIDYKRIIDTFKKYLPMVPVSLIEVYKARYQHHLLAITSGLAKYRYIIGEKSELSFDEKDYEEGEDIFSRLVATWNKHNLADFPPRVRLTMIPAGAKMVYDKLCEMDYKISLNDVPQLSDYCKMSESETNKWISYLSGIELLKFEGQNYVPFWYGTKQNKLVEGL